jgi:hypothetical protein
MSTQYVGPPWLLLPSVRRVTVLLLLLLVLLRRPLLLLPRLLGSGASVLCMMTEPSVACGVVRCRKSRREWWCAATNT